jgi:hypothetical protein
MHDSQGFDFTKFVPGFDFLKQMGSGSAAASANPAWVAPTLDPAELDKRIQELKTVHFWLDQNTKAVSATIQALEVQRMTLSALQNMNVSFGEMAEALKAKPSTHTSEAEPEAPFASKASTKSATKPSAKTAKKSRAASTATVDPSQWWGALTQQFQNIAHTTMQEMAKNADHHPGAPAAKGKSASATHKASAHAASKQTPSKQVTAKTTQRARSAKR